jgi:hypothetical protein
MRRTNRHCRAIETGDDCSEPIDQRGAALRYIGAALRGLRCGTVTAFLQDGVVVQVEGIPLERSKR